jgi:hypothetical protein
MGTGIGSVSYDDAARVIVALAKEFKDQFETILLIDRNDGMIQSFQKFL